MPKSKEYLSSSGSDSDSEVEKPKKKQKKDKKPAAKASSSKENNEESDMLPLSKMRFVSVSQFKGKKYVNIREYYEKDGEMLPGRKGIALPADQWNKLKSHIDAIDDSLDAD